MGMPRITVTTDPMFNINLQFSNILFDYEYYSKPPSTPAV